MKQKRSLSKYFVIVLICLIFFAGVQVQPVSAAENTILSSADVVKNMGIGWNLGNTLDSYSTNSSAYETYIQKRGNYQMMATYSTKYYSGWDASYCPYFSATSSNCTLAWNIPTLNSSKSQPCGNFSFQIINNALGNTGTNALNFTVTNAQFKTSSGTVINLNGLIGTYSKSIKNKVTSYVKADLTKIPQLKTSSDILGGKLTISVKINSYPLPQTPSITKEAYYETLFGNPVTTKAMIDKVKAAGFGAVRIPVTYYNHIDSQGNIDKAWLQRVAAVANYALNDGMYCIIDLHHDTGANSWLKADNSTLTTNSIKFANAWKQISTYFKDYNSKLLFEGYNEILNSNNQWTGAGASSYAAANKLNQLFVDTVRSTGSNNTTRCLVVNTYAANAEADAVNSIVLPKDRVSNRLIASVHYYGTSQSGISSVLNRLNAKFTSKGIPVIIGEFGTSFKTTESSRISIANYLITNAKKYGITCFWWDDGNYTNKAGAQCTYALLDRCSLNWYSPRLVQAIVNASK